ncbi:type II secretion/transformation system, G protein [Campylobacter sp. RM5004]|uniref:type II secretion system protein n=1 Tax=Campylobacter sp. RM5004 TaxID=1660078 RepID=UPI001EFBB8C2|nr:type II secretion system protein [Campylobacter sp. RM5004]ULO01633.1 type II secretion/transformation system, G protein [Campylobacter sp. RM5004]
MKKAFSMIEMIFAIAVIGILSAIAIPKMMANKQTAQIVKLKEQVEAIRKGIEAYAGNQYLETGKKTYPNTLCDKANLDWAGKCNFASGNLFGNVASAVKSGKGESWNGWSKNTGEVFIYYPNPKKTNIGYIFQYYKGEFNCLKSYSHFGGKVLPCSDLNEEAKSEY